MNRESVSTGDAPRLVRTTLTTESGSIPFIYPQSENVELLLRSILSNQTYPRIDFLADKIDCVLDIGANIGAASVFFHCAYPGAKIHAFEPARRTYGLLQQNTAGLERVVTVNAGLGAVTGTAHLHPGGTGGETSSLFPNTMVNATYSEPIVMRRASVEFLRRCADAAFPVLKIDTEGGEVPILRDLGAYLDRVAAVYLEYHWDKDRQRIEAIMHEHDLTLTRAHQSHPHRGENLYIRQALLDEYTPVSTYIIRTSD